MEIKKGEAKAAVEAFFEAYLTHRSLQDTLAWIEPHTQWVGTGEAEWADGLEEIEHLLKEEFAVAQDSFQFVCRKAAEQLITPQCAVVLMTAQARNQEYEIDFRVTATCVAAAGGCRIVSIHASMAEDDQPEGEFFPIKDAVKSTSAFEKAVGVKALDLLGKSIPGGMMGGYLEPGYPLYFVNNQMLRHLGYTYEEFAEAIEGNVINCMHPDDRERVNKVVEEAFAQNSPYEVQYRMQKKDGSYIWVSDTGKKGVAENGRRMCISVIRDITASLENQHKLEREAKEKEEQAQRYNRLFESVLCGIVQYKMDGKKVIFENANREAIRIFGYQPEEFWKKDDWDLTQLIIAEDRRRVLEGFSLLRGPGDKSFYEYRLRRKDGSPCWIIGSAELILDGQGNQMIQSVFLDINDKKRAQQRNRLLTDQVEASNELLRLALEHTATCEFYFYPQEKRCVLPKRLCEYYHTAPEYENMPQSMAEEKIAPEYRQRFCESYSRILQGAHTTSEEFKMKDGGMWCRHTLSAVSYDEDGNPLLAIGILEDITRQKEMEQELEEARSRDALTGLYNREAGIRTVQKMLLEKPAEEACGLLLLDMDDFERINREEGRAFADAILKEVAGILQAETGPEDVQLRLGGDEFMLFIRNCPKARATILGPHIAEQVRNILVRPDREIPLSVSVGMCVTEVVEEYNSLYRCAESTLKYVKEHGKGYAACYLDTSNELGISLTQLYTEEHRVNEIDKKSLQENMSEEDLTSFALELLGKSKKLDDAVFLLLAHIGKTLQLDRVAILEADHEFLSLQFTYQWAARRSDFLPNRKIFLNAADFDGLSNVYDENGLCSRRLHPAVPAMTSCLYAGIWNGGEFVGAMSFETQKEVCLFSKDQRRELKELVKIISSFLMKARADAVSQAKTDFLSRMSHEIRTPMNVISGMTTIAESVLDDREKALDCLKKIESANEYLLHLINDILDMSRIESGKMELNPEPMDMEAFMREVDTMLRPQAEQKGLTFRIENAFHSRKLLLGDPLRLNQVFINIIGNAIKFTQSGEVRVTVEVQAEQPQAQLKFSVKDTGVGIEAAAAQRIFNAFEQADKNTSAAYGGTGLGLSISSRLVQMMGGRLEVESEPGKGSEFYFTLSFAYAPESTAKKAEAAAEPLRPAAFDFTGKRLLLAEDNPLNQEIVCELLAMYGFETVCAGDGLRAVELFKNHEPGYFDGILMDIRMPVMDGLEATRRIRTSGRADARDIPIIALTANAFDKDSKQSIESGMNGHLSKPLQIDILLKMLEDCFSKRIKQ
ncbi:MAG: PAS domain-containing protein [Oscillospiraceae bacterium]|nr:PAS domain-containing protein [Oscillospiraceae bacterium]